MSQEILIRPVAPNEIDSLCELGKLTFKETFEVQNSAENLSAYLSKSFTPEYIREQMNTPSSEFYFALQNDIVIGYLKLNLTKEQVEIERIYVKSSTQGKGIGKALFRFALERAKSKNASHLWLGVWQENKKAIEFYKRQGLEIFDIRQFQLGSELQDDYMMRIKIN